MKQIDDEKGATQIGLHSIRNLLGEQSQTSLFSQHDQDFCKEFGLKLSGKIDRFGIDLSEIQMRVMEGILRGFTETTYKGNIEAKSKELLEEEKYSGKLPLSYKYIHELPRLKATQSQILDWSGINKSSIASWARALEALQELGTKQYCFYYDRLVLDEKGKPLRDQSGRWKKEEVIAVDTLFTIKEIRDINHGTIKYYEIIPSSLFLDQRESYFMLIPYNWRKEVKALVGNKKASSYTFRFLLFLRYQYELKRRSPKHERPYQIRWSPEEIAIAIKIPDSLYRRQRKRFLAILEDAYSVAKKLGYLSSYYRDDHLDLLVFNDSKYCGNKETIYQNKENKQIDNENNDQLIFSLFETFHELRKQLDPCHKIPNGFLKNQQILQLNELLKERSAIDIEKLIRWSIKEKFWCSRLSTIERLNKYFSEAWSEYTLSRPKDINLEIEKNKKFSLDKIKKLEGLKFNDASVLLCRHYVEIGNGVHQPTFIRYDDLNFKLNLLENLKKWGIPLPDEV